MLRAVGPSQAKVGLPPTFLVPSVAGCAHIRHSSSRSSSSSQWLARQARDPFVKSRQATDGSSSSGPTSYVARSAFKLLELQQRTGLLRPGMSVVDLGAAPGGWVQAAHSVVFPEGSARKGRRGSIVGLDLLPLDQSLDQLEGVRFVQGDFLDPLTQARLLDLLGKDARGVDLVLSDMLANLSGNSFRDAQLSLDLCQAALDFALLHLTPTPATSPVEKEGERGRGGGRAGKDKARVRLVMKHLRSELSPEFERELKRSFGSVRWEKPRSSRAESREGFWVCGALRPVASSGASAQSIAR